MYHVYFLRSQLRPGKTYVGFTELDPCQRLAVHNQQRVPSTARYAPWDLLAFVAVRERETALVLERYFKSGSGHAFWHKRFI